jgi:hypothetical protein
MAIPFKPNSLKELISDPAQLRKAAHLLARILKNVVNDRKELVPKVSALEFDDLERLLSGLLAAVRYRCFSVFPKEFKPRAVQPTELRKLLKTGNALGLQMRWKEHLSAADTAHGPVIVVEPYELDTEAFRELLLLESAGWEISLDDHFATYFPGSAACILLSPPTSKKAVSQKAAALVPKPKRKRSTRLPSGPRWTKN